MTSSWAQSDSFYLGQPTISRSSIKKFLCNYSKDQDKVLEENCTPIIVTYWKTIIAKLSSDQVEILQKFKKENGIKNNNQLVIRGLEELVGVCVADSNDPKNISLPKEYLTTYAFYEFLLSRFEKNPRITKRIKNCFLEWQEEHLTNYSHEHTMKLLELEKIWKAFKEKKKPGRPKKPKQKTGRPKDRGI